MAVTIVKKRKPLHSRVVTDIRPVPMKISRVYVAVVHNGGGEGVYSVFGPKGEALPIVAVDDKDLNALTEYAQQQCQATGQTVSIIGFTKRTHHETFRPLTTGDKK